MRQIVMDQKSNEKPQPTTAKVQTESPTPISLNGFTLQIFNKNNLGFLRNLVLFNILVTNFQTVTISINYNKIGWQTKQHKMVITSLLMMQILGKPQEVQP